MSWQFDLESCGTVTGAHSATTVSITVASGEGSRFAGAPRKLVVFEASYYDNPAEAVAEGRGEIVIQTAQSGDVLTVLRAQDGTTGLDMTNTDDIFFICNFVDSEMGGELLNVKAFGAVGDGVADDTASVELALISAADGGSVFFPAGRYKLTTWPDAGRDYGEARTLLGEGTSSCIDGPSTALFMDVSDQLYCHGLEFVGWKKVFEFDPIASNVARVCIEMCRFDNIVTPIGWPSPAVGGIVQNFSILNCLFKTLTGLAISLFGPWSLMVVDGCRFETTVDGCIKLGRDVAADDTDWRNTRVTNNSIKGVTTTTASVRAIDVFGKDVIVVGNSIENVSGGTTDSIGVHCETERGVVSKNTILNVDGSAGVRGIAIRIHGNDLAAGDTSSPDGFHVTIEGNVIDMADKVDSRGILIENDNVICVNNVIVGVRDIGIGTGSTASRTYSNLLILGNRITISTTGTPGYGIFFQSAGNGYYARDNVISGTVQGIVYQPTSGTPKDYAVIGNVIGATITGIRFAPTVTVTGIQVLNNHLIGPTTGISFQTSAADTVVVGFNTFRSVTTQFAMGALPTNLNWLEQNGDTLELHGKLDIILGGLTVTAGGITVTAGGLTVNGGTVKLEGGNVIRNEAGVPSGGTNGDIYLRTNGGAGSTFFVHEAGSWVAK